MNRPTKIPILRIRDASGNFIPINAIRGENGKSAYEHAKEGGYSGTEEEFIAFLNGAVEEDPIVVYEEATTFQNLTSGEKTSVAFGKIKKAITELISHLKDTTKHITSTERKSWDNHTSNKDNPHGVSKEQIGLSNVDNTSDADKPVSTAQSIAIAEAKKAGTNAQTDLNAHTVNKKNPHGINASQIGALPLSGGTMTGHITLSADPTEDMHPVTKKYIDSLGTTKFKLLWENAAPVSNFVSQTLTLSSATNYDLLMITFKSGASCIMAQGTANSRYLPYEDNLYNFREYARLITWSGTKIIFGDVSYWVVNDDNGVSSTDTTPYCTPYQIYGVKL